jgi:hypothetical protein
LAYLDPHGTKSACDNGAVDPIAVLDHMKGIPIPRKCLGDLACNPLRCRVGRGVDPYEISAMKPHDHRVIQQFEASGRDQEQNHGGRQLDIQRELLSLRHRRPQNIPSAHRIEPTLHWSPRGRAAYCRSMSFPRRMEPEPDWSRAGFATSTAMVSASSPSISALGVRPPRHRSGAMPRSLSASASCASVNSSASAIGRSPQLPGGSCASSGPPTNRKT